MEYKGFMLDKPFYFLDYYKFKTKIFHEKILPKSKIFSRLQKFLYHRMFIAKHFSL